VISRTKTDHVARTITWIVGVTSIVAWVAFIVASLSHDRPQDNNFRITLSAWAFWGGCSFSLLLILLAFRRQGWRKKLLTVLFGSIMLFLWVFAALGSVPLHHEPGPEAVPVVYLLIRLSWFCVLYHGFRARSARGSLRIFVS
jgi:cell division protein FtsW (lipid II flippase)